MTTPGTITRPAPHGPAAQHAQIETSVRAHRAERVAARRSHTEFRTRKLQLIPEAMARSHISERTRDAERHRLAHSVAAARRLERRSLRLQRRATRASHRARRALARAVMK